MAVSRYDRLGGADLDAAIVYEVLLPQLATQNGLNVVELTYEDKKLAVEPAFLGVAESLKTGLCNRIARLEAFGRYSDADKDQVFRRLPEFIAASCRATVSSP